MKINVCIHFFKCKEFNKNRSFMYMYEPQFKFHVLNCMLDQSLCIKFIVIYFFIYQNLIPK